MLNEFGMFTRLVKVYLITLWNISFISDENDDDDGAAILLLLLMLLLFWCAVLVLLEAFSSSAGLLDCFRGRFRCGCCDCCLPPDDELLKLRAAAVAPLDVGDDSTIALVAAAAETGEAITLVVAMFDKATEDFDSQSLPLLSDMTDTATWLCWFCWWWWWWWCWGWLACGATNKLILLCVLIVSVVVVWSGLGSWIVSSFFSFGLSFWTS